MKFNKQILTVIIFTISIILNTNLSGQTVTDYDGNVYSTVQIGEQIWMAENLKSLHYSDGSTISGIYAYNDNESNVAGYGRLYTWDAIMNGESSSNNNPSDVQGVCPTGWHVPSLSEWTELTNQIGGLDDYGGDLREVGTTYWYYPNEGATNSTGFSARGGGYKDNSGYDYFRRTGRFWSSTERDGDDAWCKYLEYNTSHFWHTYFDKGYAHSVRCVKNSGIPPCNGSLRLLFPQNNATGMPQTIKLAWEKYPFENLTYELLVKDGNQNTILSNNSITDTYYQFEIGTMQYNQTYTWKLRALLSGLPISEWSEERQFTIKAETPASPAFSSALGHFNDAVIYKNNNDFTGAWQCVEYVKRYQNVVYGLSMPSIGNADVYYWSRRLGFGRFENGGSEIPRLGDIVCLEGGDFGHVAIIRDVVFSDDGNNTNDWVYIAQQNVGSNINNHVNQQVSLTYNNGSFTISNFAGLTVSGLRRAIPTVYTPQNNEVVTTTIPLINWANHPDANNYNIMLSTKNEETGCYEEVAGWINVTTQDDYYIFPSGILESGNTYRFRVGVNFPFGVYAMTEPIYFEVSSSANSTPATVSNSFVNTSSQNLLKSGKSLTDTASNIAIYVNNDGYLLPKGFTNENGNLQFSVTPALQVGDIIVAKGAGYETTEVELTDDMITGNNINITLQEIQTDNVTNPQIEVIDYLPIITNSEITVKFTAENYTAFEILDHLNSNDTHTEFIHYSANDSIVNYTLTEFGSNEIFVRFLGEDTLYLTKTVIYNPDPAPEEYNTVTVISDANSIGTNIYLNGEFIKTIENSTEEIIVPLGLQQFSFTKQGYINYFQSTTETETINIEMEGFIPTNIEITDNDLSNIILYPNPANENVIVKLSEIAKNITIDIYDFNGKLIKSEYANNQHDIELNVSDFQTGVYYITIKSDEFVETKKLMIMK